MSVLAKWALVTAAIIASACRKAGFAQAEHLSHDTPEELANFLAADGDAPFPASFGLADLQKITFLPVAPWQSYSEGLDTAGEKGCSVPRHIPRQTFWSTCETPTTKSRNP
eukprot:GHVN01095715.1.p2 GENE.GHVN01095715.1~~GHVN01095715.1.p2  ORF type:complete len:111 (-),score=4.58 GHVN01095715.1:142-474(-)